ncbi:MAG: acyltransferase [Opitutae bacterium]|nr:acyltransferase [Opitutae bacterium]
MSAPAAGGARYHLLDHWRGFAALWVLVFHANRGRPDLTHGWLGGFATHGWLGVHVFFVISGYCIAERAAREYRQHGTARRFTLDRLLRIYPAYWAALIVTMLLNLAGALVKGQSVLDPAVLPAGPAQWLTAALAIEPWLDQPTYLLVAWTLTYEVGFYILAASALGLALRARRPWIGFAWAGGWLILGLIPATHAWLPLLILWPHFALGGVVWLAWQIAPSPATRLASGTLLIGAIYLCSRLQTAAASTWFGFACGSAWLMLVLRLWDARLAGAGALRWLGWAGTFSYSIYLVHAPIIGKIGNLIDRWPVLAGQRVVVLLASSTLTVGCAWLFYRLVEARAESFRRSLAARPAPPT